MSGAIDIPRRLVLLLDGTWNDDSDPECQTNIVNLRERLRRGLEEHYAKLEQDPNRETHPDYRYMKDRQRAYAASGYVCDGFEYLIYYDEGVGTAGITDRVKGGLTGKGLADNIRQAYKFLSFWFRPGDQIFVFGFSRGAHTARSLCGMINAIGLLRAAHCTDENEKRVWRYYRTAPSDRVAGEWEAIHAPRDDPERTLIYDPMTARVRLLGVFDTVGALGIPGATRLLDRFRFSFHDTSVNAIVDIRLQALAIDEARRTFEAAVWSKPKFQTFDGPNGPTEQVWFPGAHADIGGGYAPRDRSKALLSKIPLAWMIRRANYHLQNARPVARRQEHRRGESPTQDETPPQAAGSYFPLYNAPLPFYVDDLAPHDVKAMYDLNQHDPWGWARKLRSPACRVINQNKPATTKGIKVKGMMPHQSPIGEMVHISALLRLRQTVTRQAEGLLHEYDRDIVYEPINLIAALPFIARAYHAKLPDEWEQIVAKADPPQDVLVVGWDGHPLDTADLASRRLVCGLLNVELRPLKDDEKLHTTLHTYWRSQAAFRVRIALHLKGVVADTAAHDLLKGEQFDPAYQALNPEGVVPTLIEGKAPPLTQSLAILEYLDEKYPDPPLLPVERSARAHARALAQMVAMDAHPLIVPRVRKYLEEQLDLDRAAIDKWVCHWLDTASEAIEKVLEGDKRTGRFCVGDRITIADICLAAHLTSAQLFGARGPSAYPVAGRIHANCMAIEAFAAEHPLHQSDAPKS